MNLNRWYIASVLLIAHACAWAQQDVVLSQQQFSKINFNPAATGTSNYANAYLFARQQWAGFDGAPSTQVLNVQGYLSEIRSGFGLSISNDKIGTNKAFGMKFTYAYHVSLNEDKYLAFGISAGITSRKFGGDIVFQNPEIDPEIIEMAYNGRLKFRENVDLGVVYTAPKFSFGLSASHITRFLYGENQSDWFQMPLQMYAFTEGNINIGKSILFSPRAQFSSVFTDEQNDSTSLFQTMRFQYEVGATMVFNDVFWIGAHFRNGDGVVAQIGIRLGNALRLGYSYDIRLGNALKNTKSYGSHEIMLNYRILIQENEEAEFSPRFFE